jgi:hypothetical protein
MWHTALESPRKRNGSQLTPLPRCNSPRGRCRVQKTHWGEARTVRSEGEEGSVPQEPARPIPRLIDQHCRTHHRWWLACWLARLAGLFLACTLAAEMHTRNVYYDLDIIAQYAVSIFELYVKKRVVCIIVVNETGVRAPCADKRRLTARVWPAATKERHKITVCVRAETAWCTVARQSQRCANAGCCLLYL